MNKLLYSIGGAVIGTVLLLSAWLIGNDTGEATVSERQQQLADIALAEYEENADVSGGAKYWEYWGKSEEQWCVDFTYYCADQAGLVGPDQPMGSYTAGVGECWQRVKAQGAKLFAAGDDTPQRGDLVFWYAAEHSAGALEPVPPMLHIGIVLSYSTEDGLITIEGNSGGGASSESHIRKNYYADLYGPSWDGAAIFGFARIGIDAADLTAMLKVFEGFSKYPIWDYAQYSVGYGTRCPDDKLNEYRSYGITVAEAEALLEQHVRQAAASVDLYSRSSGLTLLTYQRDALISLTYNIGAGWTSGADYAYLRDLLQDPTADELAVVQAFANICHAGGKVLPGLIERRICEAQLYLSGRYTTSSAQTDYTYTIQGDTVTVLRRS